MVATPRCTPEPSQAVDTPGGPAGRGESRRHGGQPHAEVAVRRVVVRRRWVVGHVSLRGRRPSVSRAATANITRERLRTSVAPVNDELLDEPILVARMAPERHPCRVVLMLRRWRAVVDLDAWKRRALPGRRAGRDVDVRVEVTLVVARLSPHRTGEE